MMVMGDTAGADRGLGVARGRRRWRRGRPSHEETGVVDLQVLGVLVGSGDVDGALGASQGGQPVRVAVASIVQGVARLELLAQVASQLSVLHPNLRSNKIHLSMIYWKECDMYIKIT